MDPISIVADEVALEGLDGITIPTLWIRLEDRKPKFPLRLDDCTKELIWKSLISNSDLKFYQHPQEREDIVLFDRYKDADQETVNETKHRSSDTRKDIYPVHIIENIDGIQGSCAFFKQRTDITKNVRSKTLSPLVNLQEALERYGRKLVVVASQILRFRTLIGCESDPDLKLSDDSYCVLERVGRGRWQGELQKDLHGQTFKIDARKLFYMRKSLVRHGLITMQSHCTRLKSGHQQSSILLLLKRFHVNRRTKYDVLMEYVSHILEQLPEQFGTLLALRQQVNVDDGTLKRVLQYMRSAKLIELFQCPLEDLDPSAGPCVNKKGNKVIVRCVKLLKPYSKKGVADDEDDDDEDEDNYSESKIRALPPEGRIMEHDTMTQAYNLVLSCATEGIAQSGVGFRMNVGKLEARMICRRLEREDVIKGFMVDEGRQRTTKFISHRCVGVSNQLQLFAKEQERNKHLYSSAGQTSDTATITPSTSGGRGHKEADDAVQMSGYLEVNETDDGLDGNRGKAKKKAGPKRKTAEKRRNMKTEQSQPVIPKSQTPPADARSKSSATTLSASTPVAEPAQVEEEEEKPSSHPRSPLPQSEESNAVVDPTVNNIVEVKDFVQSTERSHETYRLLRRKNLIVEAVNNFRIIEGLFPLLKIINDEEKQGGFNTKCCKKTILRLVHRLSREGLLKFYHTTVIQDGISKKVELVVHPSIQPNDDIVNRTIEQIRFRISSSYTVVRLQQTEEKDGEQGKLSETSKALKSKGGTTTKGGKDLKGFQPEKVKGLGKKYGFQPKMPRLRVMHNYLWYLIYGYPHSSTDSHSTSQTPYIPTSCDPDEGSMDRQIADSTLSNLDVASSGDEEGDAKDDSEPDLSVADMKVYTNEDSWKRFVPSLRVHKEVGSGWAMIGDLIVCLPLSVFIQTTQINYKVDGLEEYLNDPVKQHVLIHTLPTRMKRQLLHKRKYIFSFHENLQKLVYMGLLQFGPVEKFKEKHQMFVYLKRNATIVDTTNAEAHYWLVTESPDKPFERRRYTFTTAEEVENFWFDLMCVCLNTPLGVIRSKRNIPVEEVDPSFVRERNVFIGLAHMLKGSNEVCDDGSTPGDSKGAAGLDSEFFAHLKRNWFWTNHLLTCKTTSTGSEAKENKVRLKSLLSKDALRIALRAGGSTSPRCVTTKRSLFAENVEVDIELASRNQQVVGGKGQKRKRTKKEVVKAPRKKKKEPKKRTPAHDEADHKALKMMTRQRVVWSVQEDSLIMLCSVASHLLNSKLKRPFVPYCGVRDLLHSEVNRSMDKTSVAVARRTRYILKNPQTLLNYRICLAEVNQDIPLMKMLEEKKPAHPDDPEDCAQVFSEYVRLLRHKYSSTLSPCDTTLPETKHQLFKRFRVLAIQSGKELSCKDTLNCSEDIHTIVLQNLIQSTLAMNNSQMKSSRSFQMFQLYSKYDQELLCRVFIQCRKRGLVNRRRVNQPSGPKKNRALPILPMSYQLSQSYYRCFSSRFPHSLCTETFRFMRILINNRTGDDKPVTKFYFETENRDENGKKVMERKPIKEKEDRRPVDEPKKVNEDSAKEGENVQNKVDGGTEREQTRPEDCITAGSEQSDDHLPKAATSNTVPQASEEAQDLSDMLLFTLDSPGGACVVSLSLMCLGLLTVHISIPKQIVVVDSTLVDNDAVKSMTALDDEDDEDDDGGEDCEGRKKMEVKAHQASHTNYLMMRGYCSPGIVKRRDLNTTDNIVVESCLMRLKLRSTPAHHVLSAEDFSTLDFTKCGPSLLPSSLTYCIHSYRSSQPSVKDCLRRFMEQRGYTPQDTEACLQLLQSIDAAGEKGLDILDLFQTYNTLEEPQSGCTRSLLQYMKELEEEGQLLQVGSQGVRWVLMQHADPWLLTVKSKPWSQSCLTSESLHNQYQTPFTRKRCRREVQLEAGEPPAKTSAVDTQEGGAREDGERFSSDSAKENVNEEGQQHKQTDEGDGNKLLNLEGEGEKQMLLPEEQKEEAARKKKMETEEIQESKIGASPPTESAWDDDNDTVSFISRPWRLVDSNLNRPVCKGMLEAVLYLIMSRPGLTLQMMLEHYKNVLQPMAVLDLLQALQHIGCVTKKTLVRAPKPSLFSRPVVPQLSSDTNMGVENPELVFYEPTVSCCLRLSQVLPNERHWNNCLP